MKITMLNMTEDMKRRIKDLNKETKNLEDCLQRNKERRNRDCKMKKVQMKRSMISSQVMKVDILISWIIRKKIFQVALSNKSRGVENPDNQAKNNLWEDKVLPEGEVSSPKIREEEENLMILREIVRIEVP